MDLVSSDPDASTGSYTALFGWTVREVPELGGYRYFAHAGRDVGGVMPKQAGTATRRRSPSSPASRAAVANSASVRKRRSAWDCLMRLHLGAVRAHVSAARQPCSTA